MVADRISVGLRVPPIDWRGVSYQNRKAFQGKISALCKSLQDCEDLPKWFGDVNFCPFKPVLLLIPGHQPTAIIAEGYATAAELRDCAVYYWETNTAKAEKGQSLIDFDVAREQAGMLERSKVDAAVREALWERAKKHKASPVTDPMRQPWYRNPTGRIVFPQHPGVPYEKEST